MSSMRASRASMARASWRNSACAMWCASVAFSVAPSEDKTASTACAGSAKPRSSGSTAAALARAYAIPAAARVRSEAFHSESPTMLCAASAGVLPLQSRAHNQANAASDASAMASLPAAAAEVSQSARTAAKLPARAAKCSGVFPLRSRLVARPRSTGGACNNVSFTILASPSLHIAAWCSKLAPLGATTAAATVAGSQPSAAACNARRHAHRAEDQP